MSSAGDLLLGARSLTDWTLAGGHPQRAIRGLSLRLGWHSFWFEHNLLAQTARVAQTALPEDPVFILGMWRSGTTVLHELLTACGDWVTPRTWQCFNPSTCFLTKSPPRALATQRPMDSGQIRTDGPQEDEFATLLLGEPSLYRGFIDPRRLGECVGLLRNMGHAGLPRWQDFLRGIAATAPGTRLILKSPNHTFRLPLLRALFPRAQFIWIGRHCGEVFASNMKMWRTMIERYALWHCPPGAIEHFLQDALAAYTEALARAYEELQPGTLLWIDFESLRADPRGQLERALRFACPESYETADTKRKLDRALASVPIHPGTRVVLPVDVDATKLERLMVAARQRFSSVE